MRRFLLCWLALTAAVVVGLSLAPSWLSPGRANMVQMPFAAGGGGSTPTAWDLSKLGAGIALQTTNYTNDTANRNSGAAGFTSVMGTNATPHTIGQWHIEFQIRAIDNNGWMVGFADSTVGLTSYCGTASAGFSVQAQNTVSALQGYYGGTTATLNSGVTIAVNDRIALEIWGGSANQSIWVQNFTHKAGVWTDDTGGWTGNPQTNTGGFLGSMSSSTGILPCFSGAFSGAGNAAIMYTKASQFAVAISSGGFVAWDPP